METARIASMRGHDVILMEKSNRLGGQFNIAVRVPYKEEMIEEVNYLCYQMELYKVDVKMENEADAKSIHELYPDVVVIATGARPISLDTTYGGIRTALSWDVLEDKVDVGDNVLIVGGGSVGLETALLLSKQGKRVTIIEQFKRFAPEMGAINKFFIRNRLSELNVTLKKSTKFVDATDKGVIVESEGKQELIPDIDTIIWSVGVVSNNSLFDELKGSQFEVFIIGDAKEPRGAFSAIEEGHSVALEI